ncbi:hypothetical protein BK816_05750 [Boudabousia tangfeifanii]|uniref:LysM domain-containing protein n=1 Tax=Boudabousia tangfeifanii TaxID=1912795 RepID=A0A1D9MKU7_9ACTO|nr:LysM peptidoglycan-binding domain-containing protein [Boudabousia tangfeifanii]AOZ72858.1 hypothetical protein BK816_05750 [Boudabousia tangfeifanii]
MSALLAKPSTSAARAPKTRNRNGLRVVSSTVSTKPRTGRTEAASTAKSMASVTYLAPVRAEKAATRIAEQAKRSRQASTNQAVRPLTSTSGASSSHLRQMRGGYQASISKQVSSQDDLAQASFASVLSELNLNARTIRRFVVQLLLLLFLSTLVVAFIVWVMSDSPYAGTTGAYFVEAGDNLWQIARHFSQGRSVESTMSIIRELNQLSGDTLVIGQQLIVPAG